MHGVRSGRRHLFSEILASPLHFPGPSYLRIWPHLWIVVKGIKGEHKYYTCGISRRQKNGYANGVRLWSYHINMEMAWVQGINTFSIMIL
jgi:hypothetical protein